MDIKWLTCREKVLISSHNSLGGGRYYDVESSSSFEVDHVSQAC